MTQPGERRKLLPVEALTALDTLAGTLQSRVDQAVADSNTARTNLLAAAGGATPYGSLAAFPAPSAASNAWDVSTGEVYRGSASAWTRIGNVHELAAYGVADDALLIPDAEPVSLPGPHPNGPDLATHPSVLDFERLKGPGGRWAGHRYWMAYTPYPEVKQENPCIAYSADAVTWLLPAGAANPLVPAPAETADFHNDTELVWVPETGNLRLYYRTFRPGGVSSPPLSAGGVEEWWWMESAESGSGAIWTVPAKMLDSAVAGQSNGVSMAVVRVSATEWRHYYIQNSTLRLRTSSDGVSNFSAEENLGNPWTQWSPWHIGVVRGPSGRWHLLAAAPPAGKTVAQADLSIVYASSDNGRTGWVAEETPQLEVGAWWASEYLYRPSFVLDDEATLSVRVWYGARNQIDVGQQWHIGRAVGRLRVKPRSLTMSTKTGVRSRRASVREMVLGSLSAGLVTARNVVTQGLTIRNARPEITMQDTQNNQLRPGTKIRQRHIAGTPGSIYDLLLWDFWDTTTNAWREQFRWNYNTRLYSTSATTPWSTSGWSSISTIGALTAKTSRVETSAVDLQLRLHSGVGAATFATLQQAGNSFSVQPLDSAGARVNRMEFNPADLPDAWGIYEVGRMTLRPIPASAVFSRTSVLFVDAADNKLKYKDAAGVIRIVTLS